MKPVFVDIHIHTSENPNNLNGKYDVKALLENVTKICAGEEFLIALSDHNTINKNAYMDLVKQAQHVLLAAELHIRNYEEKPPYHGHIIFNIDEITENNIDDVNKILDELYPDKEVKNETQNVPAIEEIVKKFDGYEFLLLPHGGQSHSTFDKSIPKGVVFDTTLERSIYYNQFDGFTARSNEGLEETQNYFHRLGIKEFVNLLTCSDNYNPKVYPQAKSAEAEKFLPTWMFASPTFEGLRLSLSEASRFTYCETKPKEWAEYIGKVSLKNEKISIDVDLTPGLNVVIGGSSSGKTLFVDSINSKICNEFKGSNYIDFNVEDIVVVNRSGLKPHYINQNFIMSVLSNEEKDISEIDMVNKVFPVDEEIDKQIRSALANLKCDLNNLVDNTKRIDELSTELGRIAVFTRLILDGETKENIIASFLPDLTQKQKYTFNQHRYDKYIGELREIGDFLKENPFSGDTSAELNAIMQELERVYKIGKFEVKIYNEISKQKDIIDEQLKCENRELQTKKQDCEKLRTCIAEYVRCLNDFYSSLKKIAKYDVKCQTNTIEIMGHNLSIENRFLLSKESVLAAINKLLKSGNKVEMFEDIKPESLFIEKFSKKSPKIDTYETMAKSIYSEFEKMNRKYYRIVTNEGQLFEGISPGWKSAVLLDIILGYDKDLAPLIIDQPEDNLATNYINKGLINSIKKIKTQKQIILVSHNATIPMLGDAQNIVLCRNVDGKISIRSQPLEGKIEDKSMVDYIAEITDGGKPSIKKRVKKYNLKTFKEGT